MDTVKELDPILAWIERQGVGKAAQQNTPGLLGSGVLVLLGAGTGFEPVTFRL